MRIRSKTFSIVWKVVLLAVGLVAFIALGYVLFGIDRLLSGMAMVRDVDSNRG